VVFPPSRFRGLFAAQALLSLTPYHLCFRDSERLCYSLLARKPQQQRVKPRAVLVD